MAGKSSVVVNKKYNRKRPEDSLQNPIHLDFIKQISYNIPTYVYWYNTFQDSLNKLPFKQKNTRLLHNLLFFINIFFVSSLLLLLYLLHFSICL